MGMYKYKGIKEIEPAGPKHPDREVVCTKGDGSPWSKKFYSNQHDLVRGFSQFAIGDWIEIKFDENSRFKNMLSIGPGSEPAQAPAGKSYGGELARKPDGTSRGDDTNRSAALYFAREIVNMCQTAEELHAIGPDDLLAKITHLADSAYDYIASGKKPTIAPNLDALNPPDLNDND